MTPLSRRAALVAGGSVLAGLAGCTGGPDGTDETTTDTTTTATATTTTEAPTTTTTTEAPLEWTRDVRITSHMRIVDGTVLAGDASGVLHAMAPDGTDSWTLDLGAPVRTIRVAEDTIYLMTGTRSGPHLSDSTVHAVERDGSERRWKHTVQEGFRTAIVLGEADGVLGVGLRNDMLEDSGEATFGLDAADGSEIWRKETGDVNEGVAGTETIYAADYGGVTAFDPATGEKRWTRQERYADAPLLVGDRPVIAADEVVALDPSTGDARWTYGEGVDLAGAIVLDGRLYARGEIVAALDPDGTEAWRYDAGGWLSAEADGLLFGDDESRLFALSIGGKEAWTAEKPGEHFSLTGAADSLVAGHWEGTVHAFDRAEGSKAYTFDVEADHANRVTAIGDRILVTDESKLYALEG